jgi:hypothetical protein
VVYDINCLAILIFWCKQYPDIRCPAHARQAGVQLAMGKEWAGQAEDRPVQGEPLTAVEGRGVGEAKGNWRRWTVQLVYCGWKSKLIRER